MSLTNPKDFQILLSLIPKERKENIWFFPIRANRKVPEVPSGTILKENLSYSLSWSESIQRLKWGSNVGIYAIQGGLMFLDLDVSNGKLLASQAFLDALESTNKTLKVNTRNGGFQYYFLNDGLFPNQTIKENDIAIGELRTDWFYVVGVGSYVVPDENSIGDDGTYRIIEERAITQFNPFGDYFKKNEEINNKELKTFVGIRGIEEKLEDHIKKMDQEKKIRRKYSNPERNFLRVRGSL